MIIKVCSESHSWLLDNIEYVQKVHNGKITKNLKEYKEYVDPIIDAFEGEYEELIDINDVFVNDKEIFIDTFFIRKKGSEDLIPVIYSGSVYVLNENGKTVDKF